MTLVAFAMSRSATKIAKIEDETQTWRWMEDDYPFYFLAPC